MIITYLPFVSLKWIPGFYSTKSLISTLKFRHFWKAKSPFFHSCFQTIFHPWPYLGEKRPQSFESLLTLFEFLDFCRQNCPKWPKDRKTASFLYQDFFTDTFHEISWNLLHRYIETLWAPWSFVKFPSKILNFCWIHGYFRYKSYGWLF